MIKQHDPVRILAVSGSLRAASSNTALVHAVAKLTPEGVEVRIFDALAEIPPFNPDLDSDVPPPPVLRFRAELDACDAVRIESGIRARVTKNALDWVVGSGELIAKPLALINASPRSTHAQASRLRH